METLQGLKVNIWRRLKINRSHYINGCFVSRRHDIQKSPTCYYTSNYFYEMTVFGLAGLLPPKHLRKYPTYASLPERPSMANDEYNDDPDTVSRHMKFVVTVADKT